MRLERSVRNLIVAWLGQLLTLICTFVTRKVFIVYLSQDYMGLESVFSGVLTILTLAELGVGSAITYALYKPLANNDVPKLRALMSLFRRAYLVIGCSIAAIGLALAPFIEYLIKDGPQILEAIPLLRFYFLFFVMNSAVSYFFSYKGSLIIADQQKFKVSLIQYGFQIIMSVAQVIVLFATGNYMLFLVCMVSSTLLQNIIIAHTANKMYPFLKNHSPAQPIDHETLDGIKKNVAGMVVHKLAGIANTPVSTLVISLFVGLGAAGINYGYTLITASLGRLIDQSFDAIVASAGNMSVTETKDYQHQIFLTAFFINALLGAALAVPLLCVMNIFIGELWLNSSYIFPSWLTVLIVVLFYAKSMRSSGIAFTSAYGLFWHTKWKAVAETVVMVVLSVSLTLVFGLPGVFIAGIVSSVCVSSIIEGYLLYKHGFARSSAPYFIRFAQYALVTIAIGTLAYYVCSIIPFTGLLAFFVEGLLAFTLVLGAFWLVFGRTREFGEFLSLFSRLVAGLKKRRRSV